MKGGLKGVRIERHEENGEKWKFLREYSIFCFVKLVPLLLSLSLQAIFYGFLNPVEFYIWLFSNNNVIDLL